MESEMATFTINASSIKFSEGTEPRYDAPLPFRFDTGYPIRPEPGIYTVYSWRSEGRWQGILSTTIAESARQFVNELVAECEAKGLPVAYRIEEGE